ncbi:ribonuclease Oy-like [Leptopilina heterotoma]|uniref:ribonuclease Oy-like n=1 Tax=Leptopilina heterotoma TaxID=63436 RepID=UPI001CA7BEF6|nr:ribonuclease Oy-like [Leptopilina heterotoma]
MFCLVGNLLILLIASAEFSNANEDYDILLFSQQWPITTCFQKGKDLRECNIRNYAWSIHGIWPTEDFPGTYPKDCNNHSPLNVRNLKGIHRQLENKWYNILIKNVEHFWSWEWKKHGTCSMNLQALNSQYKYFYQGLEWSKNYEIGSILNRSRIIMGDYYYYREIQTALKNHLNVTTQIICHKEDDGWVQLLYEVRICINKRLQLIDCDGHVYETNCNKALSIKYPNLKQRRMST